MKKHLIRRCVLTVAVILCLALCAQSSVGPYAEVEHDLVLISTGGGTGWGSGFVWHVDGRKYLVTNEHVIRGGQPIVARLIDGTELRLTSMEIVADRDLARFTFDSSREVAGIRSRDSRPSIHDQVWVYGDSDGADVITSEAGKILGVGSDRVEIDAQIVSGNSGSPIVDSQGRVFAVATYGRPPNDPANWVTSGTRYAEARRFGLLLDGSRWQQVAMEDYWIRVTALKDIAVFCEDLRQLYNNGFFNVDIVNMQYTYAQHHHDYEQYKDLCRGIETSVRSRNEIIARMRRASQSQQTDLYLRRRRTRSMTAEHEVGWQVQLAKSAYDDLRNSFDEAIKSGERLLDHDHWLTEPLKQESSQLLEYLRYVRRRYESEL